MLARAFQDDPAWVWLIPDAERRARLLPWLFRVGFDVTAADVWATAGAVLGAARWMPPGRAAMRVGPTLRALVTTPLRLGAATGPFLAYGARGRGAPRRGDARRRTGTSPGSASTRRRSGRASAPRSCSPGSTAAARDGLPAVLLTNSAANLPFYEGHGFEVVREGTTPENGPHAWAMVKWP